MPKEQKLVHGLLLLQKKWFTAGEMEKEKKVKT
jgi:hypothetical protein